MSFYLDASAILPLILRDAHTEKMSAWIAEAAEAILVSDFAALEFSSVVSRQVRTGALTPDQGRSAVDLFDEWSRAATTRVAIDATAMALADEIVRDFASMLAAADALHFAAARNLGAVLVTFDARLFEAAAVRGAAAVRPGT